MRAVLDVDGDAEVHWLGGGPPEDAAASAPTPVVVIDLEGAGEAVDEGVGATVVRRWVDAVGPGGHLVLAVGPQRTWRRGLDAVVASGRRWRVVAAQRLGAVVHLWLQLDPPERSPGAEGPADDQAAMLADLAEAVSDLSGELLRIERDAAGQASANGDRTSSMLSVETVVPERDREIDLMRSELMRLRADLDRTRTELRKARTSLDRIHGSLPGRVWRRYKTLLGRVRGRRRSR